MSRGDFLSSAATLVADQQWMGAVPGAVVVDGVLPGNKPGRRRMVTPDPRLLQCTFVDNNHSRDARRRPSANVV